MNNWINRDETVLLQAYEEIAAVLNQSRRGFVERIRDAHSKRTMNVIDSCCEKVHESIANMSCLVTFAKFAREMTDGKENNTVYKSIQELDAKTFWIHSFGPHCLKIDIDTFATKYHQYLIKTHLWKEGNVPVTEDTVRRIVKNIIDTSEGQADVISLVEFNAFNQRFRPMNKSFIKVSISQSEILFTWHFRWHACVKKMVNFNLGFCPYEHCKKQQAGCSGWQARWIMDLHWRFVLQQASLVRGSTFKRMESTPCQLIQERQNMKRWSNFCELKSIPSMPNLMLEVR
eukprot:TRINITY_DN5348_c0_g1_i1.p1 TRINITY_DN5348_c0_g1~~TRINITY_DN5348_c0_g1_i1.p1  ORF type:complete len:333 (-),score=65.82 TRINITY_DN5348_c0_g1_i1:1153-2016(-)